MKQFIADELGRTLANFNAMAADPAFADAIVDAVALCTAALRRGNTLLFAGNGGSAADAQHWAGELVSRFYYDRPGLAAIALTTDTSILTAIGNDYGYDYVFARQVEALGQTGDVLFAISTSGRSPNILRAIAAARARGMKVVGFTGGGVGGDEMAALCDVCFRVPSTETPRIQEGHEFIGHTVCALIEAQMHPKDAAYEGKLQQEQARYKDVADVNALPEIFHYWSHTHLRPIVEEFSINHPDDWFANHLRESAARCDSERPVFVSIGAGNCDTEVRVAKRMRDAGMQEFVIECLDINEAMLARGKEMAASEGVSDLLRFVRGDFNSWRSARAYDGVMANQSLHHVLKLEHLFDEVKRAMRPDAFFVVSDIIGRNGHQRWPEALEALHRFWRELPKQYRYNRLLDRNEDLYENWDCSNEGFEGIRAQDILPLLLQRFHFYKFIGFGNVIDPLVDRAFGHNFDASSAWDRDLIDRVHAFDERGFADGTLKPTHMFAVMTLSDPGERHYSRGLSPEFCVRDPAA